MNSHSPDNTASCRPSFACVVFDMDGLMLNTEDVYFAACVELAASRGHTLTQQVHQGMLGRRPHEAFGVMAQALELNEPVQALIDESRATFESLLDALLAPMPGLFQCLDHVRANALPSAVATSSPRKYLVDLLSRFDLLERFQTTLTAEDVVHGKPHPEIYIKAAAEFDVPPSQMLVFEDSEVGTTAAAQAGAFVVAIPNRHTAGQDFSMANQIAQRLDEPNVLELMHEIR